MSKDVENVDVLNLSVTFENDEIPDDGRVYHFYKYGESVEDTAMKIKIQLAAYRQILECLYQHRAEHHSVRRRLSQITQRKLNAQYKNKCHVCNIPINLDNLSDFVTCDSCNQSPICRNRHCAILNEKTESWNCKLCRSFLNGSNSACDWLISQLNDKLLQGKGVDGQNKIVWDNSDTNEKAPLIPLEQREKVREFVEELVSTLVGGSIDNAPVGQLYENKQCLPTGENETDSIDQSHTNLKHLVERIIEEVFKIPDLFDHSGVPSQPQRINLPQFDPKKYEELLATAVLNKLVESYSYERRLETSSGVHSGSDFESNVHQVLQKAQLETISTSSSNEPRSDSSNSVTDQPMSLTATLYIDRLSPEHSHSSPIDSPPHSVASDEEAYLSDYIQKHKVPLPGIDAHDSDSYDEDYQSVNSNDTEGNWQENWLFKKRKLKNETAAAIGMLVPSPMEDVKALIGDKTTDEVSDLSEAGSDLDDDENQPVNGRRSADLPHALVESKTIIGGKNEFGSFNEVKTIDELLQPDSLVSTQSIDNQSPLIMEAKNDMILMSECDTKPVVLHVQEKSTQNGNVELTSDIKTNGNGSIQKESIQGAESQSTKQILTDVKNAEGIVFDVGNAEPPIPTPRKKSRSLESMKQATAVEDTVFKHKYNRITNKISNSVLTITVSIQPSIQESNSLPLDNEAIVTQIINAIDINQKAGTFILNKVESTSQGLDDEFLDSSINDIYESIEGASNIDYQSLVVDDENMNEIDLIPATDQLIFQANNPFVEDCLNETTEEISDDQLVKNQFDSANQPDVSNETYICKVAPTEFDLSLDNVLQSKPIVLDDILPKDIDDKTVPQAVYISSKPALVAIEIASHETTVTQAFDDHSETLPSTSIPTLIISNICGETPPPTMVSDDYVSLKPKKVLKAQDSLEIPKEERDKYEPAKRLDSFDLDDADRNIDAKFSASENIVNVKSNPEESLNATAHVEKDSEIDENFIIVTEEEVEALKVEEQESLNKTQVQTVALDLQPQPDELLVDTNSEILLLPDSIKVTTSTPSVKRLSSSQSFEIDEIVDAAKSQNFKSVLELSPQQKSHALTSIKRQKTIDLSTDSELVLPAVQESTTHETITKTSDTNTTSNFTTNQTIILDPATNIMQLNDHGPLPGSIAEREHLKWINARDIPNNPYSREALQRRLSQKSPTKIIDINLALAAKTIDDASLKPEIEAGKPLQIILGAGEPDHLRYGRDYYINDSKAARGTRKKTSSIKRYSSTDEDNITSKATTTPDCDVFTAKIVHIKEDSGQLSDDSSKLKLSISDNSSLSLQSDSLNLSDDSETRVYDLRKNETAYLRSDIIRTSRIPIGTTVTPPPTPIDGETTSHKNLDQFFAIKQLNQLKKSEEEQELGHQKKNGKSEEEHDTTSQTKLQKLHIGRGIHSPSKPLSPETLKFFAPKPKPVFTSKIKMEDVVSIKTLITEIEDKDIPQNGTVEKTVIEEDVISSLPSVKALAKNFIEPSIETPRPPIQRPKIRFNKSFTWQISKENGNNTNGFVKGPSADSFVPSYDTSYHPVAPGHSITARSLSTKFREELKHSISDDTSNSTENIEIVEREHSPDRPSSPVLLKGIFKEKISFFQNLETK